MDLFDALHVGDFGMFTATDSEILVYGQSDLRTIVTLDADFHALLALSGATSPSVIRIRIEGLRAKELVALVLLIVLQSRADLEAGAVVTAQSGRIRTRCLPL